MYKPAYRHFWYPIITDYYVTSRYFWYQLLNPRNWKRFFSIRYNLMMGRHIAYDIYEYHYANAYRQYEIFKEHAQSHNGFANNICDYCQKHPEAFYSGNSNCTCEKDYQNILDKIVLAWESQLMLLNDNDYYELHKVNGKYSPAAYKAWAAPLKKNFEEGMALYVKYYDTFWD